MRNILITGITVMAFGVTFADTHTAASCSQANVQTAVNAASDGDTVRVPAGNCTWNAEVAITNKTIILIGTGSGNGGTKITYGGTNHRFLSIENETKTGRMDISGFWFYGGDVFFWHGALWLGGPKGWKNLRLRHNVFDGNRQWTIKGYSGMCGLIDHNTFQGTATGIMFYGDGAADWASTLTLGTSDFFFIEDNVFNFNDDYGTTKHPAIDLDAGGRTVFRHNTLIHSFWETHDKARSGLVSANAYEVYNNTFTTSTNQWKGIDVSAGTGVIWGNTFTGDFSVAIGAIDYKTSDPRSVLVCNGNDPADQNTPGQTGWRCQYQIGSMGEGATAYGYPLYLWNNTKNGSSVGMVCTDGCTHVQSGRDYINNGTTPKPGYTPYVYPHPLQGLSGTSVETALLPAPVFRSGDAVEAIYHDIQGRAVLRQTVEWQGEKVLASVNSPLPNGIYLVKLTRGSLPLFVKLLILR